MNTYQLTQMSKERTKKITNFLVVFNHADCKHYQFKVDDDIDSFIDAIRSENTDINYIRIESPYVS